MSLLAAFGVLGLGILRSWLRLTFQVAGVMSRKGGCGHGM